MKIGELAERTRVATRLVRYYEQQGLLAPARAENGYRTYTQEHVEQVSRIAGLVQAGLPTRLVKVLLEVEDAEARADETCPLELAEMLEIELAALNGRISCLTRSRDTIHSFIERTCTQIDERGAVRAPR